jgi:DNA-binding response OmpR family regulator
MAKKKVLVVDDEPSVLKVLTRRLATQNYDVVTAADGLEGLEKALADKPDVIISDIMMPGMDGYTFIKKLRANPALAAIPVIILTAKEKMQDLFLFEGIKNCDYIVKPFEGDELIARLAQLLERVKTHTGGSTPDAPARPS